MDSSSDAPLPGSSMAEISRSDELETSKPVTSEGVFDRLLDRYITVWIWSVLFGASTGLVIDLITYRTDTRWGPLNALLVLVLLVSIVTAVISWRALMKCMTDYLIPKFILHKFNPSSKPKDQDKQSTEKILTESQKPVEKIESAKSIETTSTTETQKSLEVLESEAEVRAAIALRRAFEYLLISASARVIITVLEMIYASLQKF